MIIILMGLSHRSRVGEKDYYILSGKWNSFAWIHVTPLHSEHNLLAYVCKHTNTVLESVWHVYDWIALKEASTQAEPICSENYSAKLNLLREFRPLLPWWAAAECSGEAIKATSIQRIKQWGRLSRIVSHAHIPLLQVGKLSVIITDIYTFQNSGIHCSNAHWGSNNASWDDTITDNNSWYYVW